MATHDASPVRDSAEWLIGPPEADVCREVDLILWSFRLERIRRYFGQPYWAAETADATYADRLESFPRLETVAEHSWTVADCALLLSWRFPYLSSAHAVKLAILHDKMEIIVGDLNPLGRDGTGRRGHAFNADRKHEKEGNERRAISTYAAKLEPGARAEQVALLREALECTSPEARYIKSIDKMLALGFILLKKGGRVDTPHLTFLLEYTALNNRVFPPLARHSNELLRRIFVASARQRATDLHALYLATRPTNQLSLTFASDEDATLAPRAPHTDPLSKRERLDIVFEELRLLPAARTGIEAATQIASCINRVEDRVWGPYWRPPRFVPPGSYTDRMYPIAHDSTFPVADWRVDVLVAEGELVFISATGAIQVQTKDRSDLFGIGHPFCERTNLVVFDKMDSEGRPVWTHQHRMALATP